MARRAWFASLGAAVALAAFAACSSGGSGNRGTLPATPPPSQAPAPSPPSLANVQRISTDPFTNGGSQHATEVEPAAAAHGPTIVAAFQTGRFFTHGSSDIGFATSYDGGATWRSGTLPGTTHYALPAGGFDSISDPSVAYDARHATWLIGGLPVNFNGTPVPGVVVSTSADGATWSLPIGVTAADETTNDKDWIACDDHPASGFYGRCYAEWDSFAGDGQIFVSSSGDGGRTWSAPISPSPTVGGVGGQPVVQPDGTIVMPIDEELAQHVLSFRSSDGGITWSPAIVVADIVDHAEGGELRSPPLVSAAVDAAGTVYAVWQDCRFRTNCSANDLVFSTSTDGFTWSAPSRIPAEAVTSGVDEFLPGVGIEPGTAGANAHVGVTYYSYDDTSCTASTCRLSANFIASQDGGATWGAPTRLAGPMNVSWLARTDSGTMVGDYSATVFVSGHPVSFAAIANPLTGASFDEALYASKPGTISQAYRMRRTPSEHGPVRSVHSDHPPRRLRP